MNRGYDIKEYMTAEEAVTLAPRQPFDSYLLGCEIGEAVKNSCTLRKAHSGYAVAFHAGMIAGIRMERAQRRRNTAKKK